MRRLEKQVQDSEQGLTSTTSQVSALRDAHDRMKLELDQTRADLRNTKNKNSMLEVVFFVCFFFIEETIICFCC